MEIKVFAMRTGQEVIAEVVSRNDDGTIDVKNPVMIVQIPGNDQPQMVGYCQTSCGKEKSENEIKDRDFTFDDKMFFMELEPMSYISQSYNKEFGAGIVMPDAGIVSAL